MINPNATYLGDGVYASTERGMIRLDTHNGIFMTNTVYLEPEVLAALLDYAKQHGLAL